VEAALRLFYSAIELDSDYAQAYAFATHCYCWRKNNGLAADPEEDIRETARLARRAASLGKDDAFSLCWAGYSLAHVVGECGPTEIANSVKVGSSLVTASGRGIPPIVSANSFRPASMRDGSTARSGSAMLRSLGDGGRR
jgi:hypothetical protein